MVNILTNAEKRPSQTLSYAKDVELHFLAARDSRGRSHGDLKHVPEERLDACRTFLTQTQDHSTETGIVSAEALVYPFTQPRRAFTHDFVAPRNGQCTNI